MTDDSARPDGGSSTPTADPHGSGPQQPGPQQPGPQQPGPSFYERSAPFFDVIRGWGVVRSDQRWFAGVAGGVASRLGIDPLLARGLAVVIGIVTGLGFFLYGLAWLFLPQSDGRIHAQEALRGNISKGFVGSVIFILLNLGSANESHFGPWGSSSGWPGGLVIVALAVGFGIWYSNKHRGGMPGSGGRPVPPMPPTTPGSPPTGYPTPAYPSAGPSAGHGPDAHGSGGYDPTGYDPSGYGQAGYGPSGQAGYGPSGQAGYGQGTAVATYARPRRTDVAKPLHALTLATLGVAVLTVAAVALFNVVISPVAGGAVVLALGGALAVVAVGVVVAGLLGRRAGGLAPIGVLLAVSLLLASASTSWPAAQDTGNKTVHLTSAQQAKTVPSLGAGSLTLDLTAPALLTDATGSSPVKVTTDVGVGQIVVQVPKGVAAQVKAQVDVGSVNGQGGTGVKQTLNYGTGSPVLVVDAHVGLGQILVQEVAS